MVVAIVTLPGPVLIDLSGKGPAGEDSGKGEKELKIESIAGTLSLTVG